ncbi:MAG: hypothetical protein ACM3ZR_05440 [Pseudomonadota bacterium]
MKREAYDKIVTGKSFTSIFGDNEKLSSVENYLVHVDTVDGSENNYVVSMKNGHKELSDVYVSKGDLTSLKMV